MAIYNGFIFISYALLLAPSSMCKALASGTKYFGYSEHTDATRRMHRVAGNDAHQNTIETNKPLSRSRPTQMRILPHAGPQNSLYKAKNNHVSDGLEVFPRGGAASEVASRSSNLIQTIKQQYQQRIEADPNFFSKSVTEVFLAAMTQLTAEIGKRGRDRIMPEIDFVVAGLLTAIAGKYYSMWRVAPTAASTNESAEENATTSSRIPTNAFQTDKPYTITHRLQSFLVPIPSLFKAGFIASFIGYGLTYILIGLRTAIIPSYQALTANVNILHACLYTGGFMAVVSNVRYQVLQGIVEPLIIERVLRGERLKVLRAGVIFGVRLANGLLGSWLAITGMKMMGLQKLK